MNTAISSRGIPTPPMLAACFCEAVTKLRLPPPRSTQALSQTISLLENQCSSPFWDYIRAIEENELLQTASQHTSDRQLQVNIAKLRSTSKVWHLGAIFTPSDVAAAIVKQSIPNPPPISENRSVYLDPACGAGSFLIAILRYFLASDPQATLPITVNFITKQLYGCDVDRESIAIAEFLLQLELVAHFGPSANNALPSLQDKSLIVDDFLLPSHPRWKSEIDFIFGNPPFGLSRDNRLDPTYTARLKAAFHQHKFGKINSYLLFLAQSYDILKPLGTFCLITPNAWLGIDSARAFRTKLLTTGSLSRVQSCGTALFPDQGVETLLVTVKKEENSSTVCLEESSRTLHAVRSNYLTCQELLERPAATIPIQWQSSLGSIFATMLAHSFPLKSPNSPFQALIALQEYKEGLGSPPQSREIVESRSFHAPSKETPEHLPFLLGRDIERYRIAWSGTHLRYGPWLSQPGRIERYQQPRVVLREVTKSRPFLIQSCAIQDTFLYNKSVLHILVGTEAMPRVVAWQNALALSALLNSRIMSEFLWYHGKKVQRALFPKLLCGDLNSLPIPRNFSSAVSELSRLVSEHPTDIEEQVDALVGRLYGLTPQEVHTLVTDHLATTE